MVVGYHLIWTAYGWWLPNDPRGSTSREVRYVQLQDLGELHFGRKNLQPVRRVVKEFYDEARLKPVRATSTRQAHWHLIGELSTLLGVAQAS